MENKFIEEEADIMVTVLPIKQAQLVSTKLKPIKMQLVAHKELFQLKRKLRINDLKQQTYIKVRSGSGVIPLSTEQVDINSSFIVNDFTSKKQAILKKAGYGWLPHYMIEKELKNGSHKVLNTEIENKYSLIPRLYHQKKSLLGQTAQQFVNLFNP